MLYVSNVPAHHERVRGAAQGHAHAGLHALPAGTAHHGEARPSAIGPPPSTTATIAANTVRHMSTMSSVNSFVSFGAGGQAGHFVDAGPGAGPERRGQVLIRIW